MGYHENGEPQSTLQGSDQIVEFAGADGIEAGCRLVQKHDRRIERQRTRQRHALDHAAGQFRRHFVQRFRRQSDHFQLGGCDLVEQARRQVEIFAHRELHVLAHRQRREQRAVLEQNAPMPLDQLLAQFLGLGEFLSEHLDRARTRLNQADHGAQQHRLAGAGCADKAQHLAALDVEIDAFEHLLAPELDLQIAHAQRDVLRNVELRLGAVIEQRQDIEAGIVTSRPRLFVDRSEEHGEDAVQHDHQEDRLHHRGGGLQRRAIPPSPWSRRPRTHATMPITIAMNGALIMPTMK